MDLTESDIRMSNVTPATLLNRFRGCLLGGAVGDALGAPVEFMSWDDIVHHHGKTGIQDFTPAYGVLGAITDDTQMTLFTGEGLLRANVRGRLRGISSFTSVTGHAYLRWLATQGKNPLAEISRNGWIWNIPDLHHERAPGNTCLSALMAKERFGAAATNDSKGCGGVMRVAPVGLYMRQQKGPEVSQRTFDLAADLAGLTHGHPSGRWPAGVLAILVLRALDGIPARDALPEATALLRAKAGHEETLAAIEAAISLASSGQRPSAQTIQQIGGGWVAEEALAIAIYCTLVADTPEQGIVLAVNHSGDSDSTGAITGNLLGALHGESALPRRWLDQVELKDVVGQVATDLYTYPDWRIDDSSAESEAIWERYPGG
jgi:ADP-ribosyl-[dinitrogen reductase] hydrolase